MERRDKLRQDTKTYKTFGTFNFIVKITSGIVLKQVINTGYLDN